MDEDDLGREGELTESLESTMEISPDRRRLTPSERSDTRSAMKTLRAFNLSLSLVSLSVYRGDEEEGDMEEIPFGKGLFLDIDPLLLDGQHGGNWVGEEKER